MDINLVLCATPETIFPEWINQIVQIVIAAGIIITISTLKISRKYNFLTIIENCTNEYRRYARRKTKLSKKNTDKAKEEKQELFLDLLGLFNKQLYYICKGYVPKQITIEWLTSLNNFIEGKGTFKDLDTKNRLENISKEEKDEFKRVFEYCELLKNNKIKLEKRFRHKMLNSYFKKIKC